MSESKCPAVKAMAKREAWNRNGLAENCANRIADLERQLREANEQIEAISYRLKRHELALWLCADKCFDSHMHPEGETPTQMVCEFIEEAERQMKAKEASGE